MSRSKIAFLGMLAVCGTQACAKKKASSTASATATPISLDVSDAAGFATVKTSTSLLDGAGTGSGLQKVDSEGTLTEAIKEGQASISNFYIAPGGKGIYLVFNGFVAFSSDATADGQDTFSCVLALADPATGAVTCVEDTLELSSWSTTSANSGIQSDANGNIYYTGRPRTGDGGGVLRKNDGKGHTTDLINDNLSLEAFHVLDDGSVYLTGGSNSGEFFRAISPSGTLSSITTDDSGLYLQKWPNGNYYANYGACQSINQIDTSTHTFVPTPWIGPAQPFSASCSGTATFTNVVVSGSTPGLTAITANDKLFATQANPNTPGSTFFEFYPTPAPVSLKTITTVSILNAVLSDLIIAGTDAAGNPHLSLMDTSSNTETDLMPTDKVEIYHVVFNSTKNMLFFDGLRFSDNTSVIGTIDVANGNAINMVPTTGGIKLSDLQSL